MVWEAIQQLKARGVVDTINGKGSYIAVWRSLREMSLRFAMETYQSLGQVDDNLWEHEIIYQAILDRRADQAAAAMKNHLQSSRRNLAQVAMAARSSSDGQKPD